jgi:thiamine biosynthesis lipoprotein
MIADAWATALQVLGHEKGINLVNKFNLPVFFIIKTHDGYDEVMSDSFRQYNDRTRN